MADAELTSSEEYRYDVISQVINHEIKPGTAAKLLGVSTRQIRRLRVAVEENGFVAVIHRLKGRESNHTISRDVRKKALDLIQKNYSDFKPKLATEKLEEKHGIHITSQTIRVWMNEEGLWKVRRQKQSTYRSWRPRKNYYGELIQFDGSYHHWFEDRYKDEFGNGEACMLAAIDDATGQITKATFSANEGVVAVFIFWKEYILKHGKPLAIYLDRFSTYKINHKQATDNQELMTQFQRATKELGIELLTAYSPEAKGRVERLFGTLQDRLAKEMRLEEIDTPEVGNKFLENVYIDDFNKRFSISAAKEENLHRPLTATDRANLDHIFSIQSKRVIQNDFTIQFKNNWYQLAEVQPTTIRPRETVLVEEWLDQTIHFNLRGQYLAYMVLPKRPEKRKKQPAILTTHHLNWKPADDHPWKKGFKQRS